ncbi:hypothetical protein THAPSDRAFT_269876 [Thalassiosira pseudonana CCMP1335]|jgi:hypothetical protein|uniref:Uncharacterized protein n=1 Tax=Thalassiosira pseudonana TaxID=35128 RepID=B8LCP1_THAPS|nr:hypothetical protein THAPSDRAFT_269876 [Thalassiosira pseudonana CCMP1335]EED86935.1 hypothetical protein THAPSDRAFT_269876 [Thalassiosira pseudonana CCMP1335]
MKLSTSVFFTFAVVLAVSRSSHASSVNGLRPKSGGQEGGESGAPSPERLQALIDETCPTFDCTTVNTDTLDCTMEVPPAHPDFSSMTDVEKEAFKADMVARKEAKREQMLNCACCAGSTLEDMLGRVNFAQDSRPSDSGGRGQGTPSADHLQALIDETCPTFDCTTVNTDTLDCTMEEPPARPDFSSMTDVEKDALKADMMAKKEEKKEQVMNCACCADISVEELLGGEGKVDGLSFLLESTNSDGIVATEEVSASPANRRVMSYSIGVAVASAFVYAVV